MNKSLPKKMFIIRETSDDGSYYVAFQKPSEMSDDLDGQTVGVYELKETRKLVVERRLE